MHFATRKKFSSIFSGLYPQFSSGTPEQIPETATAFSSFVIIVSEEQHLSWGTAIDVGPSQLGLPPERAKLRMSR